MNTLGTSELGVLLRSAEAVLFDFDGPVCSVFAGYPADAIAIDLKQLIRDHGVRLPTEMEDDHDPLEVLRHTASIQRANLTGLVERHLCDAEMMAIDSATPTDGGHEAIVAAIEGGKSVAIVSNNSRPAIERYLAVHHLTDCVNLVVGRAYGEPGLMKPNPMPIRSALHALAVSPQEAILVGDSLNDIEAAKAAGVAVIGYANRPSKQVLFETAAPDAVTTTMCEVASALR